MSSSESRIDHACDRFEEAWRAGQRPCIEAYLADSPEPDRPDLLRQLLRLELELRRECGEVPTQEEYERRFPMNLEGIGALFGAAPSPAPPPASDARASGARAAADENLLFGILALQLDFVTCDALIAAMHAWVLEKGKPLGRILVERGALAGPRHALLEALVREHLKQHGDDPQQSLAALSPLGSVRQDLEQVADADLTASLAQVSAARTADDPNATPLPSVGQPTSAGQRFLILRPHAKGGLGVVSVAHDQELNREVALKEIQDRHADRPESRARFLREAAITGGLEHPGIVPVYGLGQYADGRPFYAMRFVRGISLKDEIRRFHQADVPGRDPGERALALRKLLGRFLDVCNAIAYAHSRGVLHRDLKPGNIMVGKYGETLVVDWGLAKPIDRPDLGPTSEEKPLILASGSGIAETQAGSTIGTPAYMSPEQAAGRLDQLGPASDVYSLGATLYCLLTAHAPVEDPDMGRTMQRVQRGDFPPPRQVDRRIAPALEAICRKAMALNPEVRYASPRSLADDIEHWLADEPVAAFWEGWSQRLSRWARRHRAWAQAGTAALLLVTAVSLAATLVIRRSLYESQTSLARLALDRGRSLFEQGEDRQGILWLARSLQVAPAGDADLQHRIRMSLSGWGRQFHGLRASLEHYAPVFAVAFSPDGKSVLTRSSDGTAQLWDVATAKPLGAPPQHQGRVVAMAYSPDGKTILLGSDDGTVRFWEMAASKPVGAPLQLPDGFIAMAFSPDGKTVLTKSNGDTAQFWDMATSTPVGPPLQDQDQVRAVAFSPDGKTVLIGSNVPETAQLWDVATSRPVGPPLKHHGAVSAVAFSPDGKTVLTGTIGGMRSQLWDVATAVPLGEPLYQGGDVNAVAFSPDGKTVLTGGADNMARLWDVATNKPFGAPLRHQGFVEALAFSPDGKTVLTGSYDGAARLWDVASANPVGASLQLQDAAHDVAFSPDGKTVLTGGNDGTAWLWDVATTKPLGAPLQHQNQVLAVAFSPDGKTVLTAGTDMTARLWDVATTKPVGPPLQHQNVVGAVTFSPDGKTVLTGIWGGTAQLWDVATTKPVGIPIQHQNGVSAVAFGPTGKTVLTGGHDGTAQLWDVASAKPIGPPMRHQLLVQAVAFSPDGKTVLTGSDDGTAQLWDVSTAKPVGPPLQHHGQVLAVAFSPDGKTVLTAGSMTAQLWDMATAKPVGPALQDQDGISSVAFSRDGRTILTGRSKGARFWDMPTPLKGDAERIVLWSQVITGRKLNDRDGFDVLDRYTVFKLRQDLEKLGGPPLR